MVTGAAERRLHRVTTPSRRQAAPPRQEPPSPARSSIPGAAGAPPGGTAVIRDAGSLSEQDHGEEDEPDDEHAEDDPPAFGRRVEDQRSDHLSPATLAERSEEHTSELQSRENLVCRLLLEKK